MPNTEETIVRQNLMTEEGYTPYCGGCNEPFNRSVWNPSKKQFTHACGWVSEFPADFIERYINKWYNQQTPTSINQ